MNDYPRALKRRPGIALVIGIIFLPIIFAWFTLRRGYSRTTRYAAFLWLVVSFVPGVLTLLDRNGPFYN